MAWLSSMLGGLSRGAMDLVGTGLQDWLRQKREKEALTRQLWVGAVRGTKGEEQLKMADLMKEKTGIEIPSTEEKAYFGSTGGPLTVPKGREVPEGVQTLTERKLALPTPTIEEQIAQAIHGGQVPLRDVVAAKFGGIGKPTIVQTPQGPQVIRPREGMQLPAGIEAFGKETPEDKLKRGKVLAQFKADLPKQWKPTRYVPEKGEGPGMWITPGVDEVPPGYITEHQKIAAGSELDLTPPAIDAMARRYMIDGTMPGLGLGKAATKARSMVMNRVAEVMGTEGFTPQDLKTNQVLYSGFKAEATRMLGQRGPMLAFAKTADENIEVALNLSNKVGRTGSPVINRWVLAGRKSIAGDPEVAAFDAAVRTAINEYAKVTSSATGGGVTSDTARKEVETMLHSAMNPQQFKRVVDTLRLDMSNRVKGYDYQLNNIQESLKNVGRHTKGGGQLASPKTFHLDHEPTPEEAAKMLKEAGF